MKSLRLVLACIVACSTLVLIQPAHAMSSNAGCAALNGWSGTLTNNQIDFGDVVFYSDLVTYTFSPGTGTTTGFGGWLENGYLGTLSPIPLAYSIVYNRGGMSMHLGVVAEESDGPVNFVVFCRPFTGVSAPVPGPDIPAGFVLRSIPCDVPVYTMPGGIPTSATIKDGQTWFVSPTPVKDERGNSWTEIFVASYTNGFIPTRCVGGKPADYAGN